MQKRPLILVTNDDGINAPGLAVLEAIARQVAGPDGEVWVVAPAFEQSGVGHCISYVHPTMLAELGPRRFRCFLVLHQFLGRIVGVFQGIAFAHSLISL